jgi:hypothetical protein
MEPADPTLIGSAAVTPVPGAIAEIGELPLPTIRPFLLVMVIVLYVGDGYDCAIAAEVANNQIRRIRPSMFILTKLR